MKLLPNQNSTLSDLIPFAAIEHIVTDLDGTLMKDFSTVWKRVKPAIFYLRSKKVSFSIATGRSLNGAKPVLDGIKLPTGTPIVLYNGTVVVKYNSKEIMHASSIPESTYKLIIELTNEYSISAYASKLNEEIYRQNNGVITPECETVHGWGNKIRDYDYNGLYIHWNPKNIPIAPTTVVIECRDEIKRNEVISKLQNIENINITTSGSGYIEIAPYSCNKGSALQIIRKKFNWPVESVLCIGDNDNDVPLLKHAGIGIAVSNASALAKSHSSYICRNPNIEGVLDVFFTITDAKRYFSI